MKFQGKNQTKLLEAPRFVDSLDKLQTPEFKELLIIFPFSGFYFREKAKQEIGR